MIDGFNVINSYVNKMKEVFASAAEISIGVGRIQTITLFESKNK